MQLGISQTRIGFGMLVLLLPEVNILSMILLIHVCHLSDTKMHVHGVYCDNCSWF